MPVQIAWAAEKHTSVFQAETRVNHVRRVGSGRKQEETEPTTDDKYLDTLIWEVLDTYFDNANFAEEFNEIHQIIKDDAKADELCAALTAAYDAIRFYEDIAATDASANGQTMEEYELDLNSAEVERDAQWDNVLHTFKEIMGRSLDNEQRQAP